MRASALCRLRGLVSRLGSLAALCGRRGRGRRRRRRPRLLRVRVLPPVQALHRAGAELRALRLPLRGVTIQGWLSLQPPACSKT